MSKLKNAVRLFFMITLVLALPAALFIMKYSSIRTASHAGNARVWVVCQVANQEGKKCDFVGKTTRTIQNAVDRAKEGEVVKVSTGTYKTLPGQYVETKIINKFSNNFKNIVGTPVNGGTTSKPKPTSKVLGASTKSGILAQTTPPKTLFVCNKVGQAPVCNYVGTSTIAIQQAVDAAKSGDTVQIKAGVYTTSGNGVVISKNIKLRGELGVVIKQQTVGNGSGVLVNANADVSYMKVDSFNEGVRVNRGVLNINNVILENNKQGLLTMSATSIIKNLLFMKNTLDFNTANSSSKINVSYSLLYGSTSTSSGRVVYGNGMLRTNPLLDTNGNPKANSPLINAGDPNSPKDIDGTRADIGNFTNVFGSTPQIPTPTQIPKPTPSKRSNTTVTVCPTKRAGCDYFGTTTSTIQKAINAVAVNGTVYIKAGVYSLNTAVKGRKGSQTAILVNKNLSILGEPGVIITGSNLQKSKDIHGIRVEKATATIKDLHIQLFGMNGLVFDASPANNVVERVVFNQNGLSGLWVSNMKGRTIKVKNSLFYGNYNHGIYLEANDKNTTTNVTNTVFLNGGTKTVLHNTGYGYYEFYSTDVSTLNVSYSSIYRSLAGGKNNFCTKSCTINLGSTISLTDPLLTTFENPKANSPLIDAGDPTSPKDANGSCADIGLSTKKKGIGACVNGIKKGTSVPTATPATPKNSKIGPNDVTTIRSAIAIYNKKITLEGDINVIFEGNGELMDGIAIINEPTLKNPTSRLGNGTTIKAIQVQNYGNKQAKGVIGKGVVTYNSWPIYMRNVVVKNNYGGGIQNIFSYISLKNAVFDNNVWGTVNVMGTNSQMKIANTMFLNGGQMDLTGNGHGMKLVSLKGMGRPEIAVSSSGASVLLENSSIYNDVDSKYRFMAFGGGKMNLGKGVLQDIDPLYWTAVDGLSVAYSLKPKSPLIDAGLGKDPDGSVADIGLYGGEDSSLFCSSMLPNTCYPVPNPISYPQPGFPISYPQPGFPISYPQPGFPISYPQPVSPVYDPANDEIVVCAKASLAGRSGCDLIGNTTSTIQKAVDIVNNGGIVRIKDGNYKIDGDPGILIRSKNISLIGSGSKTVLIDLIASLPNGINNGVANAIMINNGTNVRVSNMTIKDSAEGININNISKGNFGNDSNIRIDRVIFINNGGGLNVNSQANNSNSKAFVTITNSVFKANQFGVLVDDRSQLDVINSVFTSGTSLDVNVVGKAGKGIINVSYSAFYNKDPNFIYFKPWGKNVINKGKGIIMSKKTLLNVNNLPLTANSVLIDGGDPATVKDHTNGSCTDIGVSMMRKGDGTCVNPNGRIVPILTSAPSPVFLADYNKNEIVDNNDIRAFRKDYFQFQKTRVYKVKLDFNGDRKINVMDYALFMNIYKQAGGSLSSGI